MKKKITVIIAIILIILAIVFVVKKVEKPKYQYETTQVEAYNYFKYKDNGKIGIIDRDGNIIIQAQYKEIVIPNPEKDIFVCYNDNEKNAVLNSSKEELFTQYDNVDVIRLKNIASVLCYEKSVLKYEKDGLYGLINFDGKELTKNIYTSIENLQSTEGKFLVSKDDKYGIINLNGKVLVDTKYDQVKTDKYVTKENTYNKSGFIVANRTDDGYKYGYINYNGKTVLKEEYSEIVRISSEEEIYLIAAKNGKYGLYKNSKELIKPDYQSIIYNDNGALIIQKNTNYGIANLKGEIVVEPKYASIETKGIYLYAASSNENQIYDINGNKIDMNFSKTVYDTENENYRIITLVNNNIIYYGIENKDGAELVNTKYRYIEYAYNDYFIAKDEKENLGIIDSNGKIVIDFKYDMIQKIKGKNMLQTLDTETYKTEIYSSDLKIACTMENAIINNNENYIEIYNENDKKCFDENGNIIDENSETIKNVVIKSFPDKIDDYTKVQNSLDDVYYE